MGQLLFFEDGSLNASFRAKSREFNVPIIAGSGLDLFWQIGPGGGGDGEQRDNRCQTASTISIPLLAQDAAVRATGIAVTSISFSNAGPINGISIYVQQPYHAGQGVTILPLTTVNIQYSGPQVGLTITTKGGGITLPTGSANLTATVTNLTYNNGQVTNVSGAVFWSIFPVGFGGTIQNRLNQNPTALNALQGVASKFGKCRN